MVFKEIFEKVIAKQNKITNLYVIEKEVEELTKVNNCFSKDTKWKVFGNIINNPQRFKVTKNTFEIEIL